jgi:hypothetical protein
MKSTFSGAKDTSHTLNKALEEGSFIEEILNSYSVDPDVVSRVKARYIEVRQELIDVKANAESEIDSFLKEAKHRLSVSCAVGDLESTLDTLNNDLQGYRLSVTIGTAYDETQAVQLLKDEGMFEEAEDRGAISTSPKLKVTKLTKGMRDVITKAGSPKVSRVSLKKES